MRNCGLILAGPERIASGRAGRRCDDGSVSATAPPDAAVDPWRDVVGQEGAVRRLAASVAEPVHAYLLVGPPGSGKQALARAFAAALLSVGAEDEAARERHVRLALAGQHPDLRLVEPEGNTFRKGDAERVVRSATLAPVEGARKVIVADGCEDMEDEAAGYLLKTVEEPPASTVFVLLTTEVVPEIVTIASRCVRVELFALPTEVVTDRLVAEGADLRACRGRRSRGGRRPRPGPHAGHRRPPGAAASGVARRPRPPRRHRAPGGDARGRAPVDDRRGPRPVAGASGRRDRRGRRADRAVRPARLGPQGPRGPSQARGAAGSAPPSCASASPRSQGCTAMPSPRWVRDRTSSRRRRASTPPRSRSSAIPTRRCCCSRWSLTSRRSARRSAAAPCCGPGCVHA